MSRGTGSPYLKTTYPSDAALLGTPVRRFGLAALGFPLVGTPVLMDLLCRTAVAVVGAHALNLVTGYAGQVSLGHAGLMAAGAFTAGILSEELGAPFWLALPAAVLVGALLGVVVGIPSLRLRGL